MKARSKIMVSIVASCLLTSAQLHAKTTQTAIYKNQRGSVLSLTWHEEQNHAGKLSGTFTTAVAHCKAALGNSVPVTGFYNGNAIALTVNYPGCDSLVAMTGNLTSDNNELQTLWLVTKNADDLVHKNWDSNLVGADSFKKQES
jgi:Avidin family